MNCLAHLRIRKSRLKAQPAEPRATFNGQSPGPPYAKREIHGQRGVNRHGIINAVVAINEDMTGHPAKRVRLSRYLALGRMGGTSVAPRR